MAGERHCLSRECICEGCAELCRGLMQQTTRDAIPSSDVWGRTLTAFAQRARCHCEKLLSSAVTQGRAAVLNTKPVPRACGSTLRLFDGSTTRWRFRWRLPGFARVLEAAYGPRPCYAMDSRSSQRPPRQRPAGCCCWCPQGRNTLRRGQARRCCAVRSPGRVGR